MLVSDMAEEIINLIQFSFIYITTNVISEYFKDTIQLESN